MEYVLKLHISILFVRFRVFCLYVLKIAYKTPENMHSDRFFVVVIQGIEELPHLKGFFNRPKRSSTRSASRIGFSIGVTAKILLARIEVSLENRIVHSIMGMYSKNGRSLTVNGRG